MEENKKNKIPNVPNLRFNNFLGEWKSITIGNIYVDATKKAVDGCTYPVFTSSRNGIELQSDHFSREQTHDVSDYHLLNDDECTFRNRSDDGYFRFNVNHLGFSGLVSKFYPVFVFKNANNDFIVNVLNNRKNSEQIMLLCTGTAQKVLSNSSFYKVKITIPSIEEQNKIALFVSLLNERIETQNKIIKDLEITKKNILRKIFCNRGQMSIGDEIKIGNYLIPGSKEPINPRDYRRITVHLNYGGLSFLEPDREMRDTRPFYLRKSGELIIGKQNYFNGSVCIVPNEFDNTVCSNAIMSFEIKNINPTFLLYAISNGDYLKARAFYANGTGQKELSEKAFLNFSIKVPDNKKQDLIANLLEKIEAKLNLERRILNNYSIEKEYFFRELFI